MIVDVDAAPAGDMLGRVCQFLSTSIHDGHVRHRICKSLRQSQTNLYTILTAKSLFDRVKKHLPGHVDGMEQRMLTEVDRFMFERRRRELEKIAANEYLLFIGCVIVASKLYMDLTYTNISWIEICHYAVEHINAVERHVLQILDYDVCQSWVHLKEMYDEFGDVPRDLGMEIRPKSGFFGWAFQSLFRFISCVR